MPNTHARCHVKILFVSAFLTFPSNFSKMENSLEYIQLYDKVSFGHMRSWFFAKLAATWSEIATRICASLLNNDLCFYELNSPMLLSCCIMLEKRLTSGLVLVRNQTSVASVKFLSQQCWGTEAFFVPYLLCTLPSVDAQLPTARKKKLWLAKFDEPIHFLIYCHFIRAREPHWLLRRTRTRRITEIGS